MSGIINVERVAQAMRDELMDQLMAIGLSLEGEVKRNAPKATASLAGSFVTRGTATLFGTEVSVGSPKWDLYGSYPEFGTRPHWAPIEPLITWVREKGLAKMSLDVKFPEGKTKRVRGQTTALYRDRKIRSIARAIQMKIAKVGTREQLYVLKSITNLGLSYRLVEQEGNMYYLIDPSSMMDAKATWDNITRRI